MIFGGISGSSTSDTASVGSILIPEMERRGYDRKFAAGITVASSTMGMIIPPSIPVVLYAVVAQESVGQLFLGGAIPGLMIGVFQLVMVIDHGPPLRLSQGGHPSAPSARSPRRPRFRSTC